MGYEPGIKGRFNNGIEGRDCYEEEYKSKCIRSSCDRYRTDGSLYCYLHKPSSSTKKYDNDSGSGSSNSSSYKPSSSSSNNSAYESHKAYDDGYNDVYEDDDYDWDRYQEDDDYASGVDDAIDDCEDEFGDDW